MARRRSPPHQGGMTTAARVTLQTLTKTMILKTGALKSPGLFFTVDLHIVTKGCPRVFFPCGVVSMLLPARPFFTRGADSPSPNKRLALLATHHARRFGGTGLFTPFWPVPSFST